MNEIEEQLESRLEQLKRGQSLEQCLSGLPEEEAELLTLSVALQKTAYPIPDPDTAAAQRANLQRLAKANHLNKSPRSGFMERVKLWWHEQMSARPVNWAAAASAVILSLLLVIAGLVDANQRKQAAEDDSPGGDQSELVAQLPEAGSGSSLEGVSEDTAENVFIPMVSIPLNFNPAEAVLSNLQGLVEFEAEDGVWTAVSQHTNLTAGQRLRTGPLSKAALTFYDGSQAVVGPRSEIKIDQLDAQKPENGFRTVVLIQLLGESEHHVQFRHDAGSRYEVQTPSGSGIARGTVFHVSVTADATSHFAVTEGRVDVTSAETTVSVAAGQASAFQAGTPPSQPAFRITGEGEVSQIGSEWIIGGQTFQTDANTQIIGDPQLGDWVWVEGRLLADGTRLADRIVLLRSTPADSFTIIGEVGAINDESWTVAGQVILVNAETDLETGIVLGDIVQVNGLIQEDGSLLALRIRLLEPELGTPFEFTGIVQAVGEEVWQISGIAITVNAETEIKGDIETGDVVKVEGWVWDGVWLAQEIKLVDEAENEFEFTGVVESIDPWVVSGIAFETRAWTEVEDGITIGDLVKVEGIILEDGTWVAEEIKRLDDEDHLTFEFYGTVDSVDPWIVSGIPLTVTGETAVDDGIVVGDLVKVTVTILPDGTWLVESITLVNDSAGQEGCFSVTAVVISVSDGQITLKDWPVFQLGNEVELEGQILPGSLVTVYACIGEDGLLTILEIIILYTPVPATPVPPPPDDENGKVTLCHKPNGNNPHEITVAQSAVPAHLNHGDTLGPCPSGGKKEK